MDWPFQAVWFDGGVFPPSPRPKSRWQSSGARSHGDPVVLMVDGLLLMAKAEQRSIGISIPTWQQISIFPQDLQDETSVLLCKNAFATTPLPMIPGWHERKI